MLSGARDALHRRATIAPTSLDLDLSGKDIGGSGIKWFQQVADRSAWQISGSLSHRPRDLEGMAVAQQRTV
jgi:hypothetical protein